MDVQFSDEYEAQKMELVHDQWIQLLVRLGVMDGFVVMFLGPMFFPSMKRKMGFLVDVQEPLL